MKLRAILDTNPPRIVRAIAHPSDVQSGELWLRQDTELLWVGARPEEPGAVRAVKVRERT